MARLLSEAAAAKVEHIIYVSIVGIDNRVSPYMRRKLEAENLISSSLIPWSIARAGGFHWLVDRLFGRMATCAACPATVRLTRWTRPTLLVPR
jgi:uncharacterized protein YbjT (DUF2867 family)